ncbi:hypothetical protein TASCI_40195 [Tenacibaculum ascidiaceicola]
MHRPKKIVLNDLININYRIRGGASVGSLKTQYVNIFRFRFARTYQ